MRSFLLLAVLAALAAYVSAECNNMCSGHGVCGTNDMCRCYRNWRGADCSERTCQFGRSFVDTAQGDLNHDGAVQFTSGDINFDGSTDDSGVGAELSATANANVEKFVSVRTQWRKSTFELFPASTMYRAVNHVYMECSNKGVCDRTGGECVCYDGYEGSACQRSVCPNSCNGHGVCRNIQDMTQSVGSASNYTYQLWDAQKIQACVCDPGYSGVDCSERLCPKGDDPLSPNEQNQVDHQSTITVSTTEAATGGVDTFSGSFRMQYTDAYGEEWVSARITVVDHADSDSDDGVAAALLAIPNKVIPSVTVSTAAAGGNRGKVYTITFTGNPGDQSNAFTFTENSLADWAGTPNAITPVVAHTVTGDKTNTECSDRGLCDYSSGVCQCFRGYRLADCSSLSALAYQGTGGVSA